MNTVTFKYNQRLGWVLSGGAATYAWAMSEDLHVQIELAILWVAAIAAAIAAAFLASI
jgi:uncharacterized membrane protein YedE/YeeE